MDLVPKKRKISLSPKGLAAARELEAQFREKFGRSPGPGDGVLTRSLLNVQIEPG